MSAEAQSQDARIREHEFDGIQEFDNRLPNWWLWTFYLAIIFSVVYWMHYHVLGTGMLPEEAYQAEMEAAAERLSKLEVTNETLAMLANEPAAVQAGEEIFMTNCAQCHKPDASGNIGPNLTDAWWIHGSEPTDIYKTITQGVVERGMQSWISLLGPKRCQQVTAYLMTIKGKDLPGKAPDKERAKKVAD